MKIFLFGFILGLVLGVGGHWLFTAPEGRSQLEKAKEQMTVGAEQLSDSIQQTISNINPAQIKEELAKTGVFIREKAMEAGQVIADATANARITASIKTAMAKDSTVSARRINVDTTDGLVTLSGTANSYSEVAAATQIALETEGVHKVISTIQVKKEE